MGIKNTNTSLRFCMAIATLVFALAGCGGGAGGGGSSVSNLPSVTIGTGSISQPVSVNVGQPSNGVVNNGNNYYVVSGLVQGQMYAIQAYNLSDDIALFGYSDPLYYLSICSSDNPGTISEACSTMADVNGKIYIRISGAKNGGSANFTLLVMPAALLEGSKASPKDISSLLPYTGTTGHGTSSYYVVNNLNRGQLYNVSLSNILYNPELGVYQNKQIDYPLCTSINAAGINENCIIAANFEGKIYISVNANNGSINQIGSYFDINVTPSTGSELVFEGYLDAPVDITAKLPFAGQVNRRDSYYKLTGLSPNTRYEVRLNTAASLSMSVNTLSTYSGQVCNQPSSSTNPPRLFCVITTSASGELYLDVHAYTAATYFIDVVPATIAEGSASTPKVISSPYDGQVDGSASYYVINGLVPNWNYKVSMSNETNNVSFLVGSSTNLTTYNAGDLGRTDANGKLYIKVDGSNTYGNGARFTLSYQVAINPEGTLLAPVDITSSSPSDPYNGQVDNRTSYYKITGLTTSNAYYMVHLSNTTQYVTAYVYDNSTFSGTVKCAMNYTNHCLASAPAGGAFYIMIVGYTGSVLPLGTLFKLWVAPSLILSEGQVSPISIAVGTPYTAGKVSKFTTDNKSNYVVSGLPGGGSYKVALSNTTDDVELNVYSDATYSAASELCHSLRSGLFDENCVATTITGGASNKTLYIQVTSAFSNSNNTGPYDGAKYTLTVTSGATAATNEGTIATPIALALDTPYVGTVRSNVNSVTQYSYYKITGLNAALRYLVKVENPTEAITAYVTSESTFTTTLCASQSTLGPYSVSCASLPSATGEMYIKIAGKYIADSSYTLKVAVAPGSEGVAGAPVNVASVPYTGTFGINPSYYTVGGLLPNTLYHATISSLAENAKVSIYSNNAFSSLNAYSVVSDNFTSIDGATDGNGSLFIKVDGNWSTTNGSAFNLNIRPAPMSEGSIAIPKIVTLATPFAGQKTYASQTLSYYKISGLVPHSSHHVSLRNRSMTAAVSVYYDSAYTHELCNSDTNSSYRIGCSGAANAAGEMYFTVNRDGGFYDIYIP